MTKQEQPFDLIWGVEKIGEVIGRTERQTHHLLNTGELPGQKVGGRWCVSRAKLAAFFADAAA